MRLDREGLTLVSDKPNSLHLDALDLETMASGHLCLNLSERVDWVAFPDYARRLLAFFGGTRLDAAESVEMRIWDVVIAGTTLRFVYDDFPQMVSLESPSHQGDSVLRKLHDELATNRSALEEA